MPASWQGPAGQAFRCEGIRPRPTENFLSLLEIWPDTLRLKLFFHCVFHGFSTVVKDLAGYPQVGRIPSSVCSHLDFDVGEGIRPWKYGRIPSDVAGYPQMWPHTLRLWPDTLRMRVFGHWPDTLSLQKTVIVIFLIMRFLFFVYLNETSRGLLEMTLSVFREASEAS